MFTGLIEEIGVVQSIVKNNVSAAIQISARHILKDINIGDSINTNGACLTVTSFDASGFWVDVMTETMNKTNLKNLKKGSKVNLERAMKIGDRIGGHMVSGHIDGTGVIAKVHTIENAHIIKIKAGQDILKYIINKGSIAIDGISLTVMEINDLDFAVSIIPHTGNMTTLFEKNPGDIINLECDMIGKYVEKLIRNSHSGSNTSKISMEYLGEHGFL